ncbi:hypothetical protein BST81_11250, partial [Leptolyngbya sp. 'hensonii']
DKLDIWVAGCPKHRELRQWVESRRMLVGEKVRLTNRITAALKSYYPQVLDWFEDKHTIASQGSMLSGSSIKAISACEAFHTTLASISPKLCFDLTRQLESTSDKR